MPSPSPKTDLHCGAVDNGTSLFSAQKCLAGGKTRNKRPLLMACSLRKHNDSIGFATIWPLQTSEKELQKCPKHCIFFRETKNHMNSDTSQRSMFDGF